MTCDIIHLNVSHNFLLPIFTLDNSTSWSVLWLNWNHAWLEEAPANHNRIEHLSNRLSVLTWTWLRIGGQLRSCSCRLFAMNRLALNVKVTTLPYTLTRYVHGVKWFDYPCNYSTTLGLNSA